MRLILSAAAAAMLLASGPALAKDHLSFSGIHIGVGAQWHKQEGGVAEGETETTTTTEQEICVSGFGPGCGFGARTETVSVDDTISSPFRLNGSDETGWAFLASLLAMQQNGNVAYGVEAGGEISDEVKGAFAMLRIGLAMANIMPYLHGGVGYEVQDLQVGAFTLEDGRLTGRVGGGLMWMLTKNVSLDANYTYIAGGDLRDRLVDGTEIEAGDQRHAVGVTARIKLN